MSTVRLRGNAPRRSSPYPLGIIPDDVVRIVGRRITSLLAGGRNDISGDDFGDIFAASINGIHRGKPLGIADVEFQRCAWSAKTVKSGNPFSASAIRLISGRNAPIYSQELPNPLADVQLTGDAVLEIWNERVNEAFASFQDLRIVVLIRNMESLEFVLTEHEAHRYPPSETVWTLNERNNLIGTGRSTRKHEFTWQPSGGQFTIHHDVPNSVRRFRITERPPKPNVDDLLASVGYQENWVQLL